MAVLATFMGICKVKDDNIVQAMQQAQADKLDHWAFYQARNLRQEMAEATAHAAAAWHDRQPPAPTPRQHDKAIARYASSATEQARKKDSEGYRPRTTSSHYDA